MIKGVNRQMIEVTDTGNPYFERALLVVRAECMEQPEVRLHEEAHKILASSDAYSGLRLSRRTREDPPDPLRRLQRRRRPRFRYAPSGARLPGMNMAYRVSFKSGGE